MSSEGQHGTDSNDTSVTSEDDSLTTDTLTTDTLTTDMFCGSIEVLEASENNEILDKGKAVAQQLLAMLPDDVDVGLIQHLRAYISGVVLASKTQKKNKRRKVNSRQLRANSLKKMFVVY